MSWSRRAFALLLLPALLAGCSLTPAFRSGGETEDRIGYAEPRNRAEQVIYQALRFSLGTGDHYILTVETETDVSEVSRVASADPATPYQLEMTAHYTLTTRLDLETLLIDETRNAAASFTRGPQQLANQSAEAEAEERAAQRLAEIIRARLVIFLETGE